jgi:hypothetical protein
MAVEVDVNEAAIFEGEVVTRAHLCGLKIAERKRKSRFEREGLRGT